MVQENTFPRSQPQESASPLGTEYIPWSASHIADPYRIYAHMRQEEPVFYSPLISAWVVSRYDDVATVLKDYQRFAPAAHVVHEPTYSPAVLKLMRSRPIDGVPVLSIVDPPVHTRLRNAISKAMSAQRIASIETRIRHLTNQLIDALTPGAPLDFMERFARPFPALVIGCLLNLPEADMLQLQKWIDDVMTLLFSRTSPEQQLPLAQSYAKVGQYVYDFVEQRRKAPQDDLASTLLKAVDEGEVPLSVPEAANLLYILLVAGMEATVYFLGNCLLLLLSEPVYWQDIQHNPQNIPTIIEEALRLHSSALSTFRRATQDVELGGKIIPRGALIQVVESSANHDETIFAHAETFDPQREKLNRHLAFGYGIHFCIGAPLVRLESRVALEQLSQCLPSLHLVPDQAIHYATSLTTHGLKQLLVEW